MINGDDRPAGLLCNRLEGRRIRVGVCREATVIAEATLPSGADVTTGADATAALVLADWSGPNLVLISGGGLLHLGPGMRIHMCHDEGEDRVKASYEELVAQGVAQPIPITVSKLNITVDPRLSVFVQYMLE